ncbi:hypothetical protein B0T16DRAFT_323778 [Cercophora newfieldiana]|uniref:Gem-associated protein 5 TPR domain-containing protein n=1 Tax=Cercophora newfieldiana TaxID=92897 RepID=A0AA40CUS5_9PEZI|nr:hypothetical protein B0T16DRAFT_323778 [Cercophora newfieldiana]
MSASHASRARAGSGASGQLSARGRNAHMGDFTMPTQTTPPPPARYFEPTAATASMFLYAQGTSIVCAHHDTLTIERRFARHGEEVQILAVDNVSDVGAGRLVVSYDAGQTAIVWDILTGDEVARFASYENLTCAAWMRNGNVAFGNIQGNVILFEPTTSEHISARTIDQISITAIAPAADCRTFAIGYQNGSLLIATLQPRFTILHNLTTSRGPSPIVTLAWHASSSRQKSDMLAVQTNDGDLRVWSVSKAYNSDDPAKVVRLLKRTENYLAGPNWMGWSKNGRIIQFSEGETISWDVRTKHVTYDTIPTLENVRGLAVYGPGASLFTLGANNTVQQFDLNAPAMLVANVQHPANLLPPSPPISLEEQDKSNAGLSETESTASIAIHADLSEEEQMSPLARLVKGGIDSDAERYRTASPVSSRSRSSVSISSSSSQTPARGYPGSVRSRGGMTEHTYISAGSSLTSAAQSYRDRGGDRGAQRESFSTNSSISMGSSHYRSRHRPSRLRNEIPRSPEDSRVMDLFKFTKSRLQDVPFKAPFSGDTSHLTNDDLRRQMLSTIFGWNKGVDELIRDEMSRHPLGSTNRILLAKWLGDINTDIMAMGSENMTSSDWMLLALSGIGGQASQHKLGRAYVQRLLENGDVHAAATIMIGLGDHNDAIEIYISHKKYMEALILSCLFFPAVWERQDAILRKWGEWAVQHGQQQLAIRCFACTSQESSEPWTSPSAQQITFQSMGAPLGPNGELLSPPMSPPSVGHGPQRSVAKASSLKLITSFGGEQPIKNKFLSAVDDGRTPLAAGVTPIADSALSPAVDPATAVLRGNRSQFTTPASARPSGGFSRQRLPSIGEAPDQSHRELLTAVAKPTKDPYPETSRSIEMSVEMSEKSVRGLDSGRSIDLMRSHTSSPRMVKDKNPPPSPSPAAVAALMEGPKRRNGSRTRIPDGLDLSLPRFHEQVPGDLTSPEQSASSSARYHWPSRRRGPGSVASSVTSASAASSVAGARSHRERESQRETRRENRTLDDYLNGLDSAGRGATRATSREGRGRVREASRKRDDLGDRGRGESRGYTPKGGKRSPKSPVPMSPEDLINLATPRDDEEVHFLPAESGHTEELQNIAFEEPEQPATVKKVSAYRDASKSRPGSRNQSRNGRGVSRDGRRARSPEKVGAMAADRGRSTTRGTTPKPGSPSSPVSMPMSAGMPQHVGGGGAGSESEEDLRQALEAQEKFRHRKSRSTSRGPRGDMMSPQSARSTTGLAPWAESGRTRQSSVSDGKKGRSTTPLNAPMTTPAPMQLVPMTYTPNPIDDDQRRLKKEAAARELEERRRSLALRPAAPPIPHPDELSPAPQRTPPGDYSFPRHGTGTPPLSMDLAFIKEDLPRSGSADPYQGRSMYASRGEGPRMGLPATPKAMRLVLESDSSRHNVPVPPLPAAYQQHQHQQNSPPIIHSNQPSPKKVEPEAAPLTLLLPSTVYTPPPPASSRTQTPAAELPRSQSAPPRDLAPPSGGSTGRHTFNKPSLSGRRPSYDAQMGIPPPPPPPPAPPMLKELQHLAQPPPPPPAPLPHAPGPKPVVYGGSTGMIEIVMDDEQQQQQQAMEPPVPTSSRNAHHRGRSSVDNSIGARITRATERMRSASRNRARDNNPRVKSPETIAPYESVPPLTYQMRADMTKSPGALRQQQDMAKSPVQFQQTDFRTGLHKSELI